MSELAHFYTSEVQENNFPARLLNPFSPTLLLSHYYQYLIMIFGFVLLIYTCQQSQF